MTKKIQCAIIGTRFGSRTILPALSKLSNVEIKYICGGKDLEKTKLIADKYCIANYSDNFDKIISDPDLDIIFIATPHDTHFDMINKALNKNINIITEKPLATCMEDVLFLSNNSKTSSKLNIVTHQLRFLPIFKCIKKIIDSMIIGKLSYIKINYQTNRLSDINLKWNWCLDSSRGGGMIIAMGSHLIDLIDFFLEKKIVSVTAYSDYFNNKIPDINNIYHEIDTEYLFDTQLDLEDGIRASIFCNGKSFQKDFLEIYFYGENGEVYFHSENGAYLYKNNEIIDIFKQYNIIKSDLSIWKEGFNYFSKEIVKNLNSSNKDFITFEKYAYYFNILCSINKSSKDNKTIYF